MARTKKDFAQMSSKKLQMLLNEGNSLTSEERIVVIELLAERVSLLKPQKTIQDYKDEFATLYSQMITEMGVDKASVSVSWTAEKENGEWVKKPNVLITF